MLRYRRRETDEVRGVLGRYSAEAGGYLPVGVGRLYGVGREYAFRFGDGAWGFGRVAPAQPAGGGNAFSYPEIASLGMALPGLRPQKTASEAAQTKYDECAKLLGNSPKPPKDVAEAILWASSLEGTDPTLIGVTWLAESGFDWRPGPNPRADGGFDVGPLQTSTTYFAKERFVKGISNDAGEVVGTNATPGEPFNGNPYYALRWGTRAINDGAGIKGRPKGVSARADMAGIYRSGSSRTGPYQARVDYFNKYAAGYDKFFECMKK